MDKLNEGEIRPTFSVLVPCYNRAEALSGMLQRTLRQRHASFEIVVVDDCSPGDAVRRCASSFEEVRYVCTDTNRGVIGARNYGANFCNGRYIVNLDDDSWFVDDDALVRLELILMNHPDVGIAAFNIATKGSEYSWPTTWEPFSVATYVGCGNAYVRSALVTIGPHLDFNRQGEELEYSLRFIDAGYRLLACPSILVFHDESPINRNRTTVETFEAVNRVRRSLALAPLAILPFSLIKTMGKIISRISRIDWKKFASEAFDKNRSFGRFATVFRRPVRTASYLKWLGLRLRWMRESRRRSNDGR